MLSFHLVNAQTRYPVSGKLKLESTKEALVGATIFVIAPDSNLVAGVVSDSKGNFTFEVARGVYTLKISYLGLQPYQEELRVWRDQYLGTIILGENTERLKGVEVKRKAPQATVEGDTTSFSSKAYKTNQNASAEDLVKKMPGMQEVNGELRAQGEKVQQVLVDGKQFFGQDPKTALNTLPAEVVDKIQVFDDKSEQSKASGIDDGTRIKTLNVVTKINMRNGEFGKVYAGGGTDSRYSAGGNLNMFRGEQRLSILGQVNNINQQNFSTEDLLGVVGDNSGRGKRGRGGRGPSGKRPSFLTGFAAGSSASDFKVTPTGGITETIAGGINYQDEWGKKIDVSSSYFYNNGDNNTTTRTYENYYLTEQNGQEYNELDSSLSQNINHKFNAKLVYKINPKASIFYLPSLTVQQNTGNSFINSTTENEGAVTNALEQALNTDLTGLKSNQNLMFRLNAEKRGRSLFVQAKHSYDNSSGDKFLSSSTFSRDTSSLDQLSFLDETTNGLTGSVMVSEPLNDKGLGGFLSYDISNSTINSNVNTYSNSLGGLQGLFDSSLSSLYTNDWLTQKSGIGFRKFNRKFGFVAKLTYQNASLNNEQNLPLDLSVSKKFNAVLPFALVRFRFKNKASLFSMYRTYTVMPQASQLSNAIDNSNPLQISTGNNSLNQQYGHWFMSKYNAASATKGTVFYAMVNGGISTNYIGQSTYTAIRDTVYNGVELARGTQLTNPVNLGGQYSINSFITYGFPVDKLKSNLNFNLSGSTSMLPSLINGIESKTQNSNVGLGVVLSSNISENIDFTVSTESNFNNAVNQQNAEFNTQYLVQVSKIKYDWIMPGGLTFRTQLQHQQYFGLTDVLDNTVLLWSAGIGKQLFKNKRGEIQLSMFDLLGQNNNIAQNFYDSYYQESNTNVLTRYVLLSFSYNIRKFREGKSAY